MREPTRPTLDPTTNSITSWLKEKNPVDFDNSDVSSINQESDVGMSRLEMQ